MVATVEKPKEKPPYYPALETLVGDSPPIEGEHVYECSDWSGRKFWVKAISPAQAAQCIVKVKRVGQKSLMYAMTQSILNRKTESGE